MRLFSIGDLLVLALVKLNVLHKSIDNCALGFKGLHLKRAVEVYRG